MEIKEAIRILLEEEYLADYIYNVRSQAVEMDLEYKGNSWDHPRVKRFEEIVKTLETFIRT